MVLLVALLRLIPNRSALSIFVSPLTTIEIVLEIPPGLKVRVPVRLRNLQARWLFHRSKLSHRYRREPIGHRYGKHGVCSPAITFRDIHVTDFDIGQRIIIGDGTNTKTIDNGCIGGIR